MNCDVCGKNMMMPDGETTLIGMTVQVSYNADHLGDNPSYAEGLAYAEFVAEQVWPYEVGREYAMCWSCWLRSLGIVPKVSL